MSIVPAHPDSVESAFRYWYARLVATLSVVSGRQVAEDAVQEAFIRASVHWWRIQHYDNPEAWIRRVAVNQLLTTLRASDRQQSAERATAHTASMAAKSANSAAVDCTIDVRRALDSLPPRQRLYLILQHVEQMRIHEIAKTAGVSEGSVKSGLHDARRNLFDALGEDYDT